MVGVMMLDGLLWIVDVFFELFFVRKLVEDKLVRNQVVGALVDG